MLQKLVQKVEQETAAGSELLRNVKFVNKYKKHKSKNLGLFWMIKKNRNSIEKVNRRPNAESDYLLGEVSRAVFCISLSFRKPDFLLGLVRPAKGIMGHRFPSPLIFFIPGLLNHLLFLPPAKFIA